MVEALVMKNITNAAENLIGEDDTGDELASANLRIFGGGEDGHHDIARVAMVAARPVIGIHHFRETRGSAVYEGSHVWRRLHPCAEHRCPVSIGHPSRKITGYLAGFAKKTTKQTAQDIDDAHFGDVYRLVRESV